MKETKTSTLSSGLVWFGAGVSIAEILTGTLIAPLGFSKGLSAIILGHFIGCTLLYLAGLIGAESHKSAMETVKLSFGEKGSLIFSSLNVLQLVGWTAVMIVSGASAAGAVINLGGYWIWSLIIGLLIAIWIVIGLKNLKVINIIAMSGLFILTVILSTVIFKGEANFTADSSISFGAAVELSIAMPLSWLPLIADYTRESDKPKQTSAVSAIVYFLVSSWMYIIGMGAAVFTGESDVTQIMLNAGLGIIALVIIIFSTVTTTFLDVYSAGVSSESISKKLKEKPVAIIVCLIGTVLAIFTPITQFEGFLYLIGSIFAPMIAIMITDFFILKKDASGKRADGLNLIVWLLGFVLYRIFMYIDTPVGNTLPVMIMTALFSLAANKCFAGRKTLKEWN